MLIADLLCSRLYGLLTFLTIYTEDRQQSKEATKKKYKIAGFLGFAASRRLQRSLLIQMSLLGFCCDLRWTLASLLWPQLFPVLDEFSKPFRQSTLAGYCWNAAAVIAIENVALSQMPLLKQQLAVLERVLLRLRMEMSLCTQPAFHGLYLACTEENGSYYERRIVTMDFSLLLVRIGHLWLSGIV